MLHVDIFKRLYGKPLFSDWERGFRIASKGVGGFQYPIIHHGDTEGTENILALLWNSSVISVSLR